MSFGGNFVNQWMRWQHMRVSVVTPQASALRQVCLLSGPTSPSLALLCLHFKYLNIEVFVW